MLSDGQPYHYPDEGDRVTVALMGQQALSPSEWERQESAVLARMEQTFRQHPHDAALDYGSGLGRLAIRFASVFHRMTSYEPDAGRARQQRDITANSPLADRIRVVSDVADIGSGYDAVICSHVIQHVVTGAAGEILRDTSARIRIGGHLLLLTTLSPRPSEMFVVGRVSDIGQVVEDEVSRATFDTTLQSGRQGILPVRFFAYDDLLAAVTEVGMDVVAVYGLHGAIGIVGPLRAASPDLLRCRDIAMLCQLRE